MKRSGSAFLPAAVLALSAAVSASQDFGFAPVWPDLDDSQRAEVMAFGEDFKQFIDGVRSHMWFVRESVSMARAQGFSEFGPSVTADQLVPGSRWYATNRDRTIALFVMGSEPITAGMRIVNTHIDSPRLEFKTRPFRERSEIVTVDAQVHGGIKNYQWVNVPLAIVGRVDKSDGSTVWVEVGTDADDPILLVTDLAPHVDSDYRDRTNRDVIRTEELEPIIASLPPEDDAEATTALDRLLALIEAEYDIEGRDFLSSDLQIVPATPPRDVGLDRALVGAYGQDDRSTGYVSLRALFEVGTPRFTAVAYAVNNEETGSWNTGVQSEWFSTVVAQMIAAQSGDSSDLALRRAYTDTQVLVSDTTTALNPLFPSPQNTELTSRLGYGMVVKEYGPGREANSEFFAHLRSVLDDAGVRWQTHSYDAGYGGATIAGWFATQNMDVIDVGIGLVSMHSPFEVSSKVDLWELYRGFAAFFSQ